MGPGRVGFRQSWVQAQCVNVCARRLTSWGVGVETWGGREGKVAKESGEGLGGQEECRVSGRAWLQGSHSAAP